MYQWKQSKKGLALVFAISCGIALLLALIGSIMGQDTQKSLMKVPAASETNVVLVLIKICNQAKTDKQLLNETSNGHSYGYWLSLYDIDSETCAPRSPEPVAQPPTTEAANTPVATDSEPYYKNCAAAWAAHAAPLHRDQPGYRKELDRDGNGIACETKP